MKIFWTLISLVGAERLMELLLAHQNGENLKSRGGYEVEEGHYKYLVLMHLLFFPALIYEVLRKPKRIKLPFLFFFLAAQGLRYWSIRSLGDRWTTRIYVVPGEGRVEKGPYRWFTHPNYAAVAMELFSFPLSFGAVRTTLLFTLLNAALMLIRIPAEEKAMEEK